MTELIAPGHRYRADLGTGIEWTPGVVRLHLRDDGHSIVWAERPHTTASAWEFWWSLAFADVFPEVVGWWFGSPWTQQVRISAPRRVADDGALEGLIQFQDTSMPALPWTIMTGNRPQVDVPDPPLSSAPANVPLRLALAALTVATVRDARRVDQWVMVSSIVLRADLARVFPITEQEFMAQYGGWQLVQDQDNSIRSLWCRMVGAEKEGQHLMR